MLVLYCIVLYCHSYFIYTYNLMNACDRSPDMVFFLLVAISPLVSDIAALIHAEMCMFWIFLLYYRI